MEFTEFRLSETGLGAHIEIASAVTLLQENLGLTSKSAIDTVLHLAIKNYEETDNYSGIEGIIVYWMVENNMEAFIEGGKYDLRGYMGYRGPSREPVCKYIDISTLQEIHREARERFRGVYSIADLNIFIEQNFFEPNIDEEFWQIMMDALGHGLFNQEYIIEHKDALLEFFDLEFKQEATKNNEVQNPTHLDKIRETVVTQLT